MRSMNHLRAVAWSQQKSEKIARSLKHQDSTDLLCKGKYSGKKPRKKIEDSEIDGTNKG